MSTRVPPPPPPPGSIAPPAPRAARRKRVPAWVGTALSVAAIAAWVIWLRPATFGGPVTHLIVSGESMEPTLYQGDLVVLRKQSTYGVGDIVAFEIPKGDPGAGAIVIHRIIETGPDGYLLQGDNKPIPDLWRPSDEHVSGKVWFHVSDAGRFIAQVRSPLWLGAFAGALSFVLAITAPVPKERARPA